MSLLARLYKSGRLAPSGQLDERAPRVNESAHKAYLETTFTMGGAANGHAYLDMTNVGDYVVQADDYLEYEVWWEAPDSHIGLDLTCSDSTALRGQGSAVDQNGFNAHPGLNSPANLKSGWNDFFVKKWYARRIPISSLTGKTVVNWDWVCEAEPAGTFVGRLRNAAIVSESGELRHRIWDGQQDRPTLSLRLTSPAGNTQVTRIKSEAVNVLAHLPLDGGKVKPLLHVNRWSLPEEAIAETHPEHPDLFKIASPGYAMTVPGLAGSRFVAIEFDVYYTASGGMFLGLLDTVDGNGTHTMSLYNSSNRIGLNAWASQIYGAGVSDRYGTRFRYTYVIDTLDTYQSRCYIDGVPQNMGGTPMTGARTLTDRIVLGNGSVTNTTYMNQNYWGNLNIYRLDVDSIEEADTLFTAEGMFVGQPIERKANTSLVSLTGPVTVTNHGNGRWTVTNPHPATNQIRIWWSRPDLVNGRTYTTSCKSKMLEGEHANFSLSDFSDVGFSQHRRLEMPGYLWSAGTAARANYDYPYHFTDGWLAAGSAVEIWDIQLQEAYHGGPYTAATTGFGSWKFKPLADPGYFYDDFTSNTASQWTAVGQVTPWTHDVAGERLLLASPSPNDNVFYIRNDFTLQDGRIGADFTDVVDGGLVLRYQDQSNMYMLAVRDDVTASGATNLQIYQRVSGAWTALATKDLVVADGERRFVEFEVDGTTLKAYQNGVEQLSVTNTAFAAAGKVGFRASTSLETGYANSVFAARKNPLPRGTFTRASSTYDQGREIGPCQPRFVEAGGIKGLKLTQGYTNILTNPTFGTPGAPSHSGWSILDWNNDGDLWEVVEVNGPHGRPVNGMRLTRTVSDGNYIMIGQNLPVVAKRSYRFWVLNESATDFGVEVYVGVTWIAAGTAVAGQWTEIVLEDKGTATGSSPNFRIKPNMPTAGMSCVIVEPAAYDLMWAPDFAVGTKAPDEFVVPATGTVTPSQGTIEFDWIPTQPVDSIANQSTSPRILQIGNYYQNSSLTLWAYNGTGGPPSLSLYIKGQTGAGWVVGAGGIGGKGTSSGWYQPGTVYRMALRWVNNLFSVFVNGVIQGTWSTASDPITSWSNPVISPGCAILTPGGDSQGNSIIANLRCSNVALDDAILETNGTPGQRHGWIKDATTLLLPLSGGPLAFQQLDPTLYAHTITSRQRHLTESEGKVLTMVRDGDSFVMAEDGVETTAHENAWRVWYYDRQTVDYTFNAMTNVKALRTADLTDGNYGFTIMAADKQGGLWRTYVFADAHVRVWHRYDFQDANGSVRVNGVSQELVKGKDVAIDLKPGLNVIELWAMPMPTGDPLFQMMLNTQGKDEDPATSLWATSNTRLSEHPNVLYMTSVAPIDYMNVLGAGFTDGVNSHIKDLTIYDRALSGSEVSKLGGSKLTITPTGDIIGTLVEDENLWPKDDLTDLGYGIVGSGGVQLGTDDGWYHQTVINNGSYCYRGYDISGLEPGESYVFEGEFWRSAGSNPTAAPVVIEQGISSSENRVNYVWASHPEETWTYATNSATCDADGQMRFLIYPAGGPASGSVSGTFRWRNVRVRKLPTKAMSAGATIKTGVLDERAL